jgi:hypothetical protein
MNRRDALRRIGAAPLAISTVPWAAVVATGSHDASAARPDQFSEAEKRLFVEDQLRDLPPRAATLEYMFSKRGSLEPNVDDTATLRVGAPGTGGARPAHVDFLTDVRRLELPDVDAATANPVILFFLERDVREMHRLTGGSTNYYRKRIRMALAEAAEVQSITTTLGPRSIAGTAIVIEPYRDDPARSRYERFADKNYRFTLSNDVPGMLVEMRSELLAPATGAGSRRDTMIAETLRFTRMR